MENKIETIRVLNESGELVDVDAETHINHLVELVEKENKKFPGFKDQIIQAIEKSGFADETDVRTQAIALDLIVKEMM